MSEPLVKCECELEGKDPNDMTDEEFQHWISKHHPDHMGFNGREGVDEGEFAE